VVGGSREVNWTTVVVSVVALAVVLGLRFAAPAVRARSCSSSGPAGVWLFDLGARGVASSATCRAAADAQLPDLDLFQQNAAVIGIASLGCS